MSTFLKRAFVKHMRPFNSTVTIPAENARFAAVLQDLLGSPYAAADVINALRALRIEIPETAAEFLSDRRGISIFSDRYGVVTNIYPRKPQNMNTVDDHPLVLQPLGVYTTQRAIIEINPGVHSWTSLKDAFEDSYADLMKGLELSNVSFWDHDKMSNIGVLPIRSDRFPAGVPVVIARHAVTPLSQYPEDKQEILDFIGIEFDPQRIYDNLRRKLADAWTTNEKKPDTEKMKSFWIECAASVRRNILASGWTEAEKFEDRAHDAEACAKAYDRTLKRRFGGMKP